MIASYVVEDIYFQVSEEPYYIVIELLGSFVAYVDTESGINEVTFNDPIPGDANMLPPTVWNMQDQNGDNLLTGIRISSSLLNAIVWAANILGNFNTSIYTQVLDANLVIDTFWLPPIIFVPADDQLFTEITFGSINVSCTDTVNQEKSILLQFHFYNLSGFGQVFPIFENQDPGFYMEIIDFDLSSTTPVLDEPPIPLPPALLTSILKEVMEKFRPLLNDVLKTMKFFFPENAMPYFPNPTLNLYNQPGCCNGQHGYLETNSYCSCGTGTYRQCNYQCDNADSINEEQINNENAQGFTEHTQDNEYYFDSYALYAFPFSPTCEINNFGDSMVYAPLTYMGGQCLPIPGTNLLGYYLIQISPTTEYQYYDYNLFCDDQCFNCLYEFNNINETKELPTNECLYVSVSQFLINQVDALNMSIFFQFLEKKDMCIGPAYEMPKDSVFLYWIPIDIPSGEFYTSTVCDYSITPADLNSTTALSIIYLGSIVNLLSPVSSCLSIDSNIQLPQNYIRLTFTLTCFEIILGCDEFCNQTCDQRFCIYPLGTCFQAIGYGSDPWLPYIGYLFYNSNSLVILFLTKSKENKEFLTV